MRRTLAAVALLALASLAGCANFSDDGGFATVADLTRNRTGQTPAYQRGAEPGRATKARVAELLQAPLTADGAVELALLNSPALQARFAELGIAEADLVQAGRLRNPSISLGRLAGGGVVEVDRAVLFDLLGLITLPTVRTLEQARFEQAQWQAAADAVALATEARQAHTQAVAAAQLLAYQQQVQEAADAAGDLARRMVAAGNFSALAQMREQAFHADATAQLARARHQAVAQRERLVRVLGLADATALKLPERLPDLPEAPLSLPDAEQTAMDQRLDVLMARRQAESTAQALGLARTSRFINVLNLGLQDQHATGERTRRGLEVELELPLFDFGSARAARAEATYGQALHRTAQVAVAARSEVREATSAYREAYALARYYRDEVVPLKKRIADESLLRYNGMLASVFELLADAREQITSVTAAVEAQRDFWLADAQLQSALTAGSPARADAPRDSAAP